MPGLLRDGGELLCDVEQFPADTVLLSLEHVSADRIDVVGAEHPLLLPSQLLFTGLELRATSIGLPHGRLRFSEKPLLHAQPLLRGETDPLDQSLHGVLDQMHLLRLQHAGGAAAVAAEAHEVEVQRPVVVASPVVHHRRPALPAVEQPLQVVRVHVAGARVPPCGQRILHPLPQRRIHEGFVRAGVLDTDVGDDPAVVRVPEDPLQHTHRQHPGRLPRPGCEGEAELGHAPGEAIKAPLPRRILRERPPDDLRALLVHFYDPCLTTLRVESADVPIPGGCAVRGAAVHGLLP